MVICKSSLDLSRREKKLVKFEQRRENVVGLELKRAKCCQI